MSQIISSLSAFRTDERRRNPRLKASSIIYAQLGSDNGGIVVNLGIDGVLCQAATQLTAETNSTFKLRLRGSGLNVELVGDLAWLGATQKEVGISFKSPSTSVQRDIADWIARETPGCETAASHDRSQPKAMSTMPVTSATAEKSVPHSLSAALAMSRAMPADPPLKAGVDASVSPSPSPLDSATEISGAAPPEIVSATQQSNVPTVPKVELEDHSRTRNADSAASPEEFQVERLLYSRALFERPAIANPSQSPTYNPPPIVLPEAAIPRVREELPRPPAEPVGKSESSKTEEIKPTLHDRATRSPGGLVKVSAADRWIPPALLAAWRQGDRPQRLLLAGSAAAAFLGILALIVISAVAHIDSSAGRSTGNGSAPQFTARPTATIVTVDSPQNGPLHTHKPPRVIVVPQTDGPPPSLLGKFAQTFLGDKSDDPADRIEIEIGEDQVGVQVWTSKPSGYYYCADSPFYNTLQPGSFMAQRDALQTGYQPILGQLCN